MSEVFYRTDGMTEDEAQEMRKIGAQVYVCWFCRDENVGLGGKVAKGARIYWFDQDTIIKKGEHVVRCRRHRDA